MDAIDLLTQQHREIERLFSRVEGARRAEQPRHFAELARALRRHSFIEREILYDELQNVEASDTLADALDEHDNVDEMLEDIERTGVVHQSFFPRLAALRDHIREHVRREEEELLPRVRELFSDDDRETMGRDLQASGEEWDEEDQSETELVEPQPQTLVQPPLD